MDFGTVDIGFCIACKWVSWSSHHFLLAHQMQGPCVGVSRAATVVALACDPKSQSKSKGNTGEAKEVPPVSCSGGTRICFSIRAASANPFRLFLEESGENWSSIGVFDHSHRVDFKQIPPLGSALIKGNGVVGLE